LKIVQPDWTVVNPVHLANPAEKILIRKILSSITSGSGKAYWRQKKDAYIAVGNGVRRPKPKAQTTPRGHRVNVRCLTRIMSTISMGLHHLLHQIQASKRRNS
jgi:hypothetical protein